MDAGDTERWKYRTLRIKEKLEQEFPGHSCVRVIIDYLLVHGFRLDDDTGVPRYLVTVFDELLTDADLDPLELIEQQDTIEAMRVPGFRGVPLRHPDVDRED
jgi:hypothetical protein